LKKRRGGEGGESRRDFGTLTRKRGVPCRSCSQLTNFGERGRRSETTAGAVVGGHVEL